MSGWSSERLSALCEFDPSKSQVRHLASGTIVTFLPMNDLGIGGQTVSGQERRPISEAYRGYTYFADGDVLLAKITPCFENGKLGVAANLENEIGFGSSEFMVLRPGPRISARYLAHYLSQDRFRRLGVKAMTGAVGHKRVPKEWVQDFEIPLPPLAEQQRIVAILDEAFEGIAATELAYRANLVRSKTFGQITLREVLDIGGDGWEDVNLHEVASVESGAGFPSAFQGSLNASLAFFKVGDMNAPGNEIAIEFPRHTISEETRVRLGARVFPIGSVIFPKVGGAIATDKKRLVARPCCVDNNIMGIIPNPNKLDSGLLYQLMINKPLTQFSNDAGLPSIRKTTVEAWGFRLPADLAAQKLLADRLAEISFEVQKLSGIYERKLSALAELKQSLLARAFSGELIATTAPVANKDEFATPEQAANILAFMHWQHERANRVRFFGHVMGQKTLDLIERVGGVELGRKPYKDAAGPNDRAHMVAAERWAKQQGFFEFVERSGGGYDFKKLSNYDAMLTTAKKALKPIDVQMARVTEILVGKDKEEVEVFATVLAAWNNLVVDGVGPSEAAILCEAREDWHPDKLAISIGKFLSAIGEIRRRNLVPNGTAKVVRHRQASLL